MEAVHLSTLADEQSVPEHADPAARMVRRHGDFHDGETLWRVLDTLKSIRETHMKAAESAKRSYSLPLHQLERIQAAVLWPQLQGLYRT